MVTRIRTGINTLQAASLPPATPRATTTAVTARKPEWNASMRQGEGPWLRATRASAVAGLAPPSRPSANSASSSGSTTSITPATQQNTKEPPPFVPPS
jgi:hypothetical protein